MEEKAPRIIGALNAEPLSVVLGTNSCVTDIATDEYSLVYDTRRLSSPEGYLENLPKELYNATPPYFLDNGLDGYHALILRFRRLPQMIIGMSLPAEDTIMIEQIQGVRLMRISCDNNGSLQVESKPEKPKGLFAIRNIGALGISIVEAFALKADYSKVIVKSVDNSPWVEPDPITGEPHVSVKQLDPIYDEAAAELGYMQSSGGNWSKVLKK